MSNDVYSIVRRQIARIASGPDSAGRATLAKLRRGAGKRPGSVPEIWDTTIGALPEDAGEFAENAVHVALTLFAVHRQGTMISGQSGGTLGSAVAKLKNGDNDDAVTRRFNSAVTSATIAELSIHARSLIQLLKSKGIDMDYPRFAEELYYWQFNSKREEICLHWGRNYWRSGSAEKQEDKQNDTKDE